MSDKSRNTQHATRNTQRILRAFLPVFGLLALIGYFGPWVDHKAAGLAILGLDLGEYVKFLPAVRSGEISLWREGFYLPLVVVSLVFSLYAYRAELDYPWYGRAGLLAVAVAAALNLLPPAWTPQRMLTPEFQQQSWGIVICLAAVAFSPVLAWLPRWTSATIAIGLCLAAASVPVWQFLQVLPGIGLIYNGSLAPGWGLWVMEVGLTGLMAVAAWVGFWQRRSVRHGSYGASADRI